MSNRQIYLALYKGRRNGTGWRVWAARFTDGLTRVLTRGRYSHCEIAYGPAEGGGYDCISSSVRDGGVRSGLGGMARLLDERADLGVQGRHLHAQVGKKSQTGFHKGHGFGHGLHLSGVWQGADACWAACTQPACGVAPSVNPVVLDPCHP